MAEARTIKSGGKVGKKYYYVYETGEVTSSSDPTIAVGSNVYEQEIRKDPRPAKDRPTDTDENRNRIRSVTNSLIGIKDPDVVMAQLLQVLEKADAPIPGKYYVYRYRAITPNIRYDRNPVVQMRMPFGNGWVAQNYHWLGRGQSVRKYLSSEVVSDGIYEIYPSELRDVLTLPLADFAMSS